MAFVRNFFNFARHIYTYITLNKNVSMEMCIDKYAYISRKLFLSMRPGYLKLDYAALRDSKHIVSCTYVITKF